MTNSNKVISNDTFRDFQAYAVGLGGLGPIALFLFLALAFGIKDLTISKGGTGILLILFFLVLVSTLFLYHKERHHGNKEWFSGIYVLQAMLSFALTHFLIYYTGGARNSVFSFTCLYIPSIVGYVYGKKGVNFIGAAALMFLSYTYNLFYPKIYNNLPDSDLFRLDKSVFNWIDKPVSFEWLYLSLFIIQLYVLWQIASQKSENSDVNSTPPQLQDEQ